MKRALRGLLVLLAALLLACGSESGDPDASFGDAQVTVDGSVQLDASSPPPDAGVGLDAEPVPDAQASPDAAALDAGPDADGGGGPIQAVLDQLCPYYERIGVVTVSDWGNGQLYLDLQLQDIPMPWWGPPTLQDAACQFHTASEAPCECTGIEVCSYQAACVQPPVPAPLASIVVTGGGGTQTFTGDGAGTLGGEVTLADEQLRLSMVAGALEIETPPMSVPPALINPSGVLTGDYSNPLAMDLSWTAPVGGAHVYSNTRINHHVFEPTFTTCVVPASAGSLHIDGAMLQPLAVATGLEFQGLEHTRFAAATTAGGCVEFRFRRSEFFNIE